MMKRYLLFGSAECYYACGGMHDFIDSFESIKSVVEFISNNPTVFREFRDYPLDWFHLYDSKTKKNVMGSQKQPYGNDDLADCSLLNTYILFDDKWTSLEEFAQKEARPIK